MQPSNVKLGQFYTSFEAEFLLYDLVLQISDANLRIICIERVMRLNAPPGILLMEGWFLIPVAKGSSYIWNNKVVSSLRGSVDYSD